jgi:hypothetical protein
MMLCLWMRNARLVAPHSVGAGAIFKSSLLAPQCDPKCDVPAVSAMVQLYLVS